MFLNDDFLLTTDAAKTLYHNYASKMPIVDYHCHLNPKEIYEDKPFKNITEAWLYGDHYKWRLMRANGIDERYITGDASDYDKFLAFAKTIPYTLGNPLYAWTHLELKRFFGIDKMLNEDTAEEIWNEVNEKLSNDNYTRRNFIRMSNVKVVCTTDDPVDNLEYHKLIAENEKEFKVFPAFRPDNALRINAKSFNAWYEKLAALSSKPISSYQDYIDALNERILFFHENNCRLSDHALDDFTYVESTEDELDEIILKAINGQELNQIEIDKHVTATLIELFKSYHTHGWTMQLHLKALRNNNNRMFELLGPDTGYDGINDREIINSLRNLLSAAEDTDQLPKTILYSLNPNDYPALLALMGCFQKETVMKFQLGSAWWFNDTRSGMREQIDMLANSSLLPHFVGMLTDSRSFLSYTRHEYFRRVLCELIGEWVERGEAPNDMEYLGKIVENISFNNAHTYFGFDQL